MDEVADVIEPLAISNMTQIIILKNYAHVEDGHLLKWDVENYTG